MVEHLDLGLRVATVVSCQKVAGTRMLHEIIVDCGEDGLKKIASSIPDQDYRKEIIGKQILIQIGVPPVTEKFE